MTLNNNVPYVYLDFDAQNLYIAGFFQAGSQDGYSIPVCTQKQNTKGTNYLDVQISVSNTGNSNNHDGVMTNISQFMACSFALITQTNSDQSKTKTKIHIEPATSDGE